mgnify:FL=1
MSQWHYLCKAGATATASHREYDSQERRFAFSFAVPGDPVPKPRPRVMANGGVYYPEPRKGMGYTAFKGWVQICFLEQAHRRSEWPSTACFALEVEYHTRGIGKRDVDNIAGSFMDALQGLVWVDDRLVTDVRCFKVVDVGKRQEPYCIVRVGKITN